MHERLLCCMLVAGGTLLSVMGIIASVQELAVLAGTRAT